MENVGICNPVCISKPGFCIAYYCSSHRAAYYYCMVEIIRIHPCVNGSIRMLTKYIVLSLKEKLDVTKLCFISIFLKILLLPYLTTVSRAVLATLYFSFLFLYFQNIFEKQKSLIIIFGIGILWVTNIYIHHNVHSNKLYWPIAHYNHSFKCHECCKINAAQALLNSLS